METRIGCISHYYNRIGVAVLDLTEELTVGDQVHIIGHTTDFFQEVSSMEIEHKKITSAGPGDEVAIKINEPARKGDEVHKVLDKST